MEKEVPGWPYPKSYSEWLSVQVETANEGCPSRDRLILFNGFINDRDGGSEYTLRKWTDDTKLSDEADVLESRDVTWGDLDRLEGWSHMNLIKLNKTKGKVLT